MWDRKTNVKRWRLQKNINFLQTARGVENGMFSLIVPYTCRVSSVTSKLDAECQKAEGIENPVHKASCLWAIKSAKERLALFDKVPFDGIALYTGTVVTEEGKEEPFTTSFEPSVAYFNPIKEFVYEFDNKFHTEALQKLLGTDERYGFILMGITAVTFDTLSGNTHQVLHRSRFCSEQIEENGSRRYYSETGERVDHYAEFVKAVAKDAGFYFTDRETGLHNVKKLILGGQRHFMLAVKNQITSSLQEITHDIIESSYGQFEEVVEKSNILDRTRFMYEKFLIRRFSGELRSENGTCFFGLEDTLKLIFTDGAIDTLILWEDFDDKICVMKSLTSGRTMIKGFTDGSNDEWVVENENASLVEWLAEEYVGGRFNSFKFEIVGNHTQESSTFCKGLGGIGGIILKQQSHDDDDGDFEDEEVDHADGEIPEFALWNFWDDDVDFEDEEVDHADGEIPEDDLPNFWDGF